MSASAPGHPHPDELLLWHAGELDRPAADAVTAHLQSCASCRAIVGRAEALMRDVAALGVAGGARRVPMVSPSTRRAVAGGAVIVLLLIAGRWTSVTPTAQADALIGQAVQHEGTASGASMWRVTSGAVRCDLASSARRPTASRTAAADATSSALCDSVARGFDGVGWPAGELLSARRFQRWRDSLASKHDAIFREGDQTEITTTTTASPLRKAMIRVRTADHRLVAGRFEFAANGENPAGAIDVAAVPADEAHHAASEALADSSAATTPSTPSVTPRDLAEADVRLVLHALGLDTDVLVAVSRHDHVVEVWGVVPDAARRTELKQSLQGLTAVINAIGSGAEDGLRPSRVPWQAFTGDAAPLASDWLDGQFGADSDGRQAFVNGLDLSTRRLVGAARSRDRLLHLAQRLPAVRAFQLRELLPGLERAMATDLDVVARALRPLVGQGVAPAPMLSAAQAEELYVLVHELVYLGVSSSPRTLADATRRVSALLLR